MFVRGWVLSVFILFALAPKGHAECGGRPMIILPDSSACLQSFPLTFSLSQCINFPNWCKQQFPAFNQYVFLFRDGSNKIWLGDATGRVWQTYEGGYFGDPIPDFRITQLKDDGRGGTVAWTSTKEDPDHKVTNWTFLTGAVGWDLWNGKNRIKPKPPEAPQPPPPPTPRPPTKPDTHDAGTLPPAPKRRPVAAVPTSDELITKLKSADECTDKNKIWKWGSDLLGQINKEKAKELLGDLHAPVKDILAAQVKARWETPAPELVDKALKNENSRDGRAAKEEFERRRDKDPEVEFIKVGPRGNFPLSPEDAIISAELIQKSDKEAGTELGELMGTIDNGSQLKKLRENLKAKLDSMADTDPKKIFYKRINWAAGYVGDGKFPEAATEEFKKAFEPAYKEKLAANAEYHKATAAIAAEKDAAKRATLVDNLANTYGNGANAFTEFNLGGQQPHDRRGAETFLAFARPDAKGNLSNPFQARHVGFTGSEPLQTAHLGNVNDNEEELLQRAKAAALEFNKPKDGESTEPKGAGRLHRFAIHQGPPLDFNKSKHFAAVGGKLTPIDDQEALAKVNYDKLPLEAPAEKPPEQLTVGRDSLGSYCAAACTALVEEGAECWIVDPENSANHKWPQLAGNKCVALTKLCSYIKETRKEDPNPLAYACKANGDESDIVFDPKKNWNKPEVRLDEAKTLAALRDAAENTCTACHKKKHMASIDTKGDTLKTFRFVMDHEEKTIADIIEKIDDDPDGTMSKGLKTFKAQFEALKDINK